VSSVSELESSTAELTDDAHAMAVRQRAGMEKN
jgi:hypothetical protein